MSEKKMYGTIVPNNNIYAKQYVTFYPDEQTESKFVPEGGAVGQVLTKNSDDDNDIQWVTPDHRSARSYPESWSTDQTLLKFCQDIENDENAVIGEQYLGELTCSGLPDGIGNAEVTVYITGNHVILLTLTSTNVAPYHWELSYLGGSLGKWRTPNLTPVKWIMPVNGFKPNIVYNLGEVTGTVSWSLDTTDTDSSVVNRYCWTFSTETTPPTITWPAGITWINGTAPTIDASKHYEISIIDNVASYLPNVSGGGGSSGVTDVTVGGTSVVSNGVAAIPSIPTVPTISTDIQTDKASDVKTASPKAVYDEVHPAVGSSQPQGGMLPNVLYNLGTLSGSVTISLASPTDNAIENEYRFTFTADSTAPTITWPNTVTKWIGNSLDNGAPKVEASTYYEVSIEDGYGIFNAF